MLRCSAISRMGVDAVWDTVQDYRRRMEAAGAIAERRAAQADAWMWNEVGESLLATFRSHPAVRNRLEALEGRVRAGTCTPTQAAQELLTAFLTER